MSEATYAISAAGGSITCLKCGRTSHNPNDVKNRYCGHCDWMHDLGRGRRLEDVIRLHLERDGRLGVDPTPEDYDLADLTGAASLTMCDGRKRVAIVGLVRGSGKPIVHPLKRPDALLLLARLGLAIDEAWPPGEGVRPC